MSQDFPVEKILLIQTAFLGDVILATSLIEQVRHYYPAAKIHVLVRKGAESLLQFNPHVEKIVIWNKKQRKFYHLFQLIKKIREEHYDVVLNLQRFFSSGLLTACSKAKITIGFSPNPWHGIFTKAVAHQVPMMDEQGQYIHEVQRNFFLLKELLRCLGQDVALPKAVDLKPQLYFGHQALNDVVTMEKRPYVIMAPASVWFTKQWPKELWSQLISKLPEEIAVFLVGGPEDFQLCQEILLHSQKNKIVNTCGKLSLLQTALLMKNARRVFCNDSAPSHLASAVNAPQTVIFCSTVPAFGFGPLSDQSHVVSVDHLSCRPCGVHGHQRCPKKHFQCAFGIDVNRVLSTL